MKNILFPLDLYQDSQSVLEQALAFLQGVEGTCNVILLKTYMVPVSLSEKVIETHDEVHHHSVEELKKGLKIAKEFSVNGKISFEPLLQMGKPANVISRLVKEKNIDCVILESSGNGSRREEMMNLLDRIHCPIMIFPR